MIPGDSITDSQRNDWTILRDLGRGLWGQSWLVQNNDGREAVLKAPLRASDFPNDVPLPDGIENACNQCLREQFTLLESAKFPFLPKLEGLTTLRDGRRALLLTRYNRISLTSNELPVEEVLSRLLKVAKTLERHGRTHGNLRPSNILWNERNEPVLTDLLTPTANKLRTLVANFDPQRKWDLPPEAHGYPTPVWDTWALCLALYRSLTISHEHPNGDIPQNGIDKLQLAALKDLTIARLKSEGTNLRFIGRVTDKTAAMLNRGLSGQPAPSPPYRFTQVAHLGERLVELYNLSVPKVESVGKLLFTTPALDNVFTGDGPVKFSVSIGCSSGITTHDDIVCGVQLVDLDGDGQGRVQIENLQYDASTHASGRLRFRFNLPSVLPGRYEIRVAFSVKGSGNAPTIAAGTFEMRPQPGYVPPSQPITSDRTLSFPPPDLAPVAKKVPLNIAPSSDIFSEAVNPTISPLEDMEHETPSTSPESFYSDPGSETSDPGGELIEGFFPKPIAPSQADSLPPTASIVATPRVEAPVPASENPTPTYEPQRMVASAAHASPPVEQVTPQLHSSATDATAQYSAPSAFFQQSSPVPSTPVAEPAFPTTPFVSHSGHEPSVGSMHGGSASGATTNSGWFEQSPSPEALFGNAGKLDEMMSGAFDIEDLPTCTETRERQIPWAKQVLHRAVRMAQDDLYVATILAATTCMSGILLLTLLLKSCG